MSLTAHLRKNHFQFSRNFSPQPSPIPDLQTCISFLQSFSQNQELSRGRTVHALMLSAGHLPSPFSATSLINMYSKCNAVADAFSVFHESTDFHNVFVYNSIIAGLTGNGLPKEAFDVFCRMRLSSGLVPDKFTFPCVIKACSNVLDLKNVHGLLYKLQLGLNLFIASALLHSYLKFELMSDAQQLFERLSVKDDIVLWNTMINGYVQIGEFNEALSIFKRMASYEVIPNRFTVTGIMSALALAGDIHNCKLVHAFAVKLGYDSGLAVSNALIDTYGKCGQLVDALTIFKNIVDKDIYSWNSIITVHERCSGHEGSLKLLKAMLSSGFRPDLVTITAALPTCANLAALMHGREIHGYMVRSGLDKLGSTYSTNAIVDMYVKCGSMREARLIFEGMKIKDVASWNIMVMGYGMHGFGKEAMDFFSRMLDCGLKPDAVSFVGILSACSHAGFVDRGRELLSEMQPKYGVAPTIEHYSCVIDMLGRAGRVEEAHELILSMSVEPNQVVWRAFLSACRLHGNADLAEVAARRVLEIGPGHCGNYVLMSNVYGAAGKYDEVAELRHTMRENDVKKSPGCSWG
ncbi:Pentatricopeptide repeat-containing protein [Striga hermonthica]|uniref:Pentatricopeptide repeat-containing protein n=1 Tax=Striga hermonthica TaxID=68872 RepID=A0A9N7R313_STRHE|nr:Pentatricopeptide repeat-containing protein [Striga hermonthica]